MDVSRWHIDADENREAPPDGAPEGWPWTKVARTIREWMAAVVRWYEDAEWLDLAPGPVTRSDAQTFAVEGNATGLYIPGIRVRMKAGLVIADAQVLNASFVFPTTLVEVDGAEVPLGCDAALVHVAAGFLSAAFRVVRGVNPAADELPVYNLFGPIVAEVIKTETLTTDYDLAGGLATLFQATLTGADGVLEFWLSVNLVATVPILNFGYGRTISVRVLVGPPAGPTVAAFTAVIGTRRGPPLINFDRTFALPRIPLGVPPADSVVSFIVSDSGGAGTHWHFLGSTTSPLQATSYEVTRSLT